ncbi:hypothetical protein D7Y13_09835 [Corallococcus praedator]|uniref:DUF3592 domain-containing protein n=1 Tax=Corallococcus praedator TaxID=2316724 RepID=A0ABX9QL51_9BACT|nr:MULTISPECIES: hypothetical protein [Corallococcus]RKH26968.1 hypothetical protein D7X75_27400 [Corallococcus sp. CA031C]RKI12166.1 hypothetical protein D7Y13_09835 [Corallococcus praedator]
MAKPLDGGSRLVLWIVILFCGGMGSLLLSISVGQLRDTHSFLKHAVKVEAICSASVASYCVQEIRSRSGGVTRIQKYDCYTPEVRYVLHGQTFTRKMHDMKSPDRIEVGAPVALRVHDRGYRHDVRPVSGFMDLWGFSLIWLALALAMLLVAVLGVGSELRRAFTALRTPSPG